jgi:predicted ferric reductase
MVFEISSTGVVKNGISELGKVDKFGVYKTIELSWLNRIIVNAYDKLFFFKIRLLMLRDRIEPIKSNLSYISIAVLGATTYYLINHFFDGFLQNLINNSNLAQSIIVFLSLSSIINIFHPFTLRKEVNIKEVDELIKKKTEKMREALEYEKRIEEGANG